MVNRQQLSESIANYFDRDHCVLVGRATTGLTLLFNELVDGTILYPSYICPIAVYPAYYTGKQPRFCDVSLDDYNATPKTLSDSLSDDVDAVVVTHMFGHPVEMDQIQKLCSDYGVTIIEDACNAFGARHSGRLTGSFGDASVVSFGPEKPVDAGGGGAILTDDAMLAERLREKSRALPIMSRDELERRRYTYVEVYSAIQSLRSLEPRAERLLLDFPSVFERFFVHGFPNWLEEPLNAAFNDVDELVSRRREVAAIYKKQLDACSVKHPDTVGDAVPFRYGVLLETSGLRDAVLSRLRERGYPANSLHEPVHHLFGTEQGLIGADAVSSRILNLGDYPLLSNEKHRRYAATVNDVVNSYS